MPCSSGFAKHNPVVRKDDHAIGVYFYMPTVAMDRKSSRNLFSTIVSGAILETGIAMYTKDDLTQDFLDLGVRPGSVLALHSSFKSVGAVEGSPETVLDALLQALGPEGTLMVPTPTYNMVKWTGKPFVQDTTPSRVGLLTELTRKRPGALRSLHPTHSVAAIGPLARELTENHLASTPLGLGSPWDRLRLAGGDVLMLGTGLDTCTLIHLAESLAPAPYLHITHVSGQSRMAATYRDDDGVTVLVRLSEVPGCSLGFDAAKPVLNAESLLQCSKVSAAETTLMPAREGCDAIVEALRKTPTFLLCEHPRCLICPARRDWAQTPSE